MRARRKTQHACPEIRVRLNGEFLAGRPDAAAVVTRLVDTLRQGMPYAAVDLAAPRRGGGWAYVACILLGAALAVAAGHALDHRGALRAVLDHAEAAAPAPEPAVTPTPAPDPATGPAAAYTLGAPLPAQDPPADEPSLDLARELVVCAGLSAALLAHPVGPLDISAALGDANRALERSAARQAERAKLAAATTDLWRAEGAEELRSLVGRNDVRPALRRLAECRSAVGREIALPR